MSRERGDAGEQRALAYLQEAGLTLRQANYHCRFGEIDLIMQDGETLVFIEVRQRSRTRFASAVESIGYRKQRRLITTANHYLQRQRRLPPCRFDVVCIDDDQIDWIKNAFEA